MYAGSKYESHYTVWTARISIRVRVRVRVYFILKNLVPPGTTVHVPTAVWRTYSDSVIHKSSLGFTPIRINNVTRFILRSSRCRRIGTLSTLGGLTLATKIWM